MTDHDEQEEKLIQLRIYDIGDNLRLAESTAVDFVTHPDKGIAATMHCVLFFQETSHRKRRPYSFNNFTPVVSAVFQAV